MNAPIDKGTISLPMAVMLAAACVGAGIAWQDVKGDIVDHETRVTAMEGQIKRGAATLDAICETLQCRQKGMVK